MPSNRRGLRPASRIVGLVVPRPLQALNLTCSGFGNDAWSRRDCHEPGFVGFPTENLTFRRSLVCVEPFLVDPRGVVTDPVTENLAFFEKLQLKERWFS